MTIIHISNDEGDTIEVFVDLDGTWRTQQDLPDGITEDDIDEAVAKFKRDVEWIKGQ